MMMEFILLIGLLAVASNPSPYYAALGLVVGAVAGSVMLSKIGVTFLSLVLMLIYLGGMMVVFAYCTALVAEPYPEAWGSTVVLSYLTMYLLMAVLGYTIWMKISGKVVVGLGWGSVSRDWLGVSQMFNDGSWMLLFGGLVLLLALLVVLEVVRGHYSGALRAV